MAASWPNFCSIQRTVEVRSWSNIHSTRPSAQKFLQRSESLLPRPCSLTASRVRREMSRGTTSKPSSEPSVKGLLSRSARFRRCSVNADSSTMISAPGSSNGRFTTSAAGLKATSTSGESPGVVMRSPPNWIWNADTPKRVPVGARISAGKSGRVARSWPDSAEAMVNCWPCSWMPSPESPARRTTWLARWWSAGDPWMLADMGMCLCCW